MKMLVNDWENSLNAPDLSKSLPNCHKMSQNVQRCPKMSTSDASLSEWTCFSIAKMIHYHMVRNYFTNQTKVTRGKLVAASTRLEVLTFGLTFSRIFLFLIEAVLSCIA